MYLFAYVQLLKNVLIQHSQSQELIFFINMTSEKCRNEAQSTDVH